MSKFPKELEFSRDYCFFLNNSIYNTWLSAEEAGIFKHRVDFKNRSQSREYLRIFNKGDSEKFRKWFVENDQHTSLYFLTLKAVLRGLIRDFHNYVFEAIENINRGNYSIAYTLLRKPFKENLFLIEWIVANPVEFMTTYNFLDSEKYAPLSFFGKKSETRSIIENATAKVQNPHLFDHEFIYEMRYDKSMIHSFDQLWNLSTHLVTNRKNIKTESFNLNFIFSNTVDELKQLYQIFSVLPILLLYSNEIIDAAMRNISELGEDEIPTRRIIGYVVWFEERFLKSKRRKRIFKLDLKQLTNTLSTSCEICSKKSKIYKADLKEYCLTGKFPCKHCGNERNLDTMAL